MQRFGQSPAFEMPGTLSDGEMPISYTCDPDPFDGDLIKCQDFILQGSLVFSQRVSLLSSDSTKMNFIIGLLQERALAWVQVNAAARRHSLSFEHFLTRFKRVFNSNHAGCAGDWLFTLLHGRRSVADYAVETVAARVAARAEAKAGLLIPFSNPSLPAPRAALHALVGTHTVEPMQLGGTRLSPVERCRWFTSDSCLYCGQTDYFIASCPVRPKDRARQQE